MHFGNQSLKNQIKLFSILSVCFISILFLQDICYSNEKEPAGLKYHKRHQDNHVIHILEVDSKQYRLKLVKAHNQVFGRETVPAIAKRTNAIAAINGGFFEIGNSEDGHPSGTLLIEGVPYSLKEGKRTMLMAANNKVDIIEGITKLKLDFNNKIIVPNTFNHFVKNNEIAAYNHTFGFSSLTPYNRKEILIDNTQTIVATVDHGDNQIPNSGWILSFPKESDLSFVKVGQKVKVNFSIQRTDNSLSNTDVQHILMGIPRIVKDGVALKEDLGRKSFAEQPHARTALGIKQDGNIVIVVTEHAYSKPIQKITIGELQSLLNNRGYSKQQMDSMTFAEVLPMLQKQYVNSKIVGLSLPDLATLMVSLGVIQAINLDGGGSSTLYLNNQVMNVSAGDEDEALGQKVVRPVSDAIVFVSNE